MSVIWVDSYERLPDDTHLQIAEAHIRKVIAEQAKRIKELEKYIEEQEKTIETALNLVKKWRIYNEQKRSEIN